MPEFVYKGTTYMSTQDVAQELGVKAPTVRAYIKRGVLPDVQMMVVGTRRQRGFTKEWVAEASAKLQKIAEGESGNPRG